MAQAAHGGYTGPTRESWTGGAELFASVMMIIIGLFQLSVGLAAIMQSSFYVVADSYIFSYNLTAWGWAHLVIGLLVGLTGIALAMGQSWARIVGIVLVGISALGNFLFIPYQPMWSLLIIAIDVAVIYALATRSRELQGTSSGAQ